MGFRLFVVTPCTVPRACCTTYPDLTGTLWRARGWPVLSTFMRCQVDTYSGSRLHERPRRFTWGEEWLEVRQVLAQWYTPDHLGFRVRAADGRVYTLTYHSREEAWEAVLAGPEAQRR